MPARISFTLHGSASDKPFEHARALQALVYGWIQAINPSRATAIHDEMQTKPFGIAPLQAIDTETYQLKVSCLDEELARIICAGAMLGAGKISLKAHGRLHTLTLNQAVAIEESSTWQELRDNARPATSWTVRLLSPTAFKNSGRLLLSPTADRYFSSWYYRWNNFAPKPIEPIDLLDFVRSHINITYLEGKTVNVPIEPQQLQYPGFCGTVVFAVHEPGPEHKPYLQALDQLALFANYAGTGTQTMRGMGVTRVKRANVVRGA
jgi:CRISPR-associated endoribonuclease Cas6